MSNFLFIDNYLNNWGLGIGDWGLGQSPIPNPQSPIPIKYSYYYKLNSLFIITY